MEIVIRAAVVFILIWVLLKIMGKRELAELTAFELVVLVTMGDLIQQAVTQEDMSITGGLLSVTTIAWLAVFTSKLSYRFARLRPLLEGVPIVVVRDGRIIQEAVRLETVDMDELYEEARRHGIGNMDDVVLGVLEPDGRFSFIQRDSSAGSDDPDDDRAAQ